MESEFDCIQAAAAELGECPRWHVAERQVYWTDIDGRRLWRVGIDGDAAQSVAVPWKVGAFVFRQGGGLVLATDQGVMVGDPFRDLATVEQVQGHPEPHLQPEGGRYNDGCCDPAGRLVVGTLDPAKQGRAGVYCIERDATTPRKVMDGFSTFNGLAFTPDGSEAWFTDTPTRTVWRAPYDISAGTFGGREVVRQFDTSVEARPDGASFDHQGRYWLALYAGGRVVCLDRAGEIHATIRLPATYTTMACFAGDDLDTLVVTTGTRGDQAEIAAHPAAGGLFAMRGMDCHGTITHNFA